MSNPASAYGYNVFEGNQRGGFKDECLMTQTINFPTAGLHRFLQRSNIRIRKRIQRRKNPEQLLRHDIDACIRTLCRKNCCYQKFKCVFMLKVTDIIRSVFFIPSLCYFFNSFFLIHSFIFFLVY